MVFGPEHGVTDHNVVVHTAAVQFADGSIDNRPDRPIDAPHVMVVGHADTLNSGQARELAAALLEAADELEVWTTR